MREFDIHPFRATTPVLRLAFAVVLLGCSAAALAAAEASVSKVTRVRAEQLVDDGRRGAASLLTVASTSGPYLSVSTFVRVVCESFAAVFVTITCAGAFDRQWVALLVAAGIMVVASFVLVGVSPRTVGRQHADPVALLSAPVPLWLSRVLGPLARLLVALGNAVTPGARLPGRPVLDRGRAARAGRPGRRNAVIEAAEQQMIHSVFELGDTIVREVMVPRTDMVTIEHDKALRQAMSLFLRSGFSRIPVVDGGPDDVLGMLYLKDVTRQVYSDAAAEQPCPCATSCDPCTTCPRASPSTTCCARCSATRRTSPSSSTSTAAPPAWSPSRTCSRRSSARSPTSTTARRRRVERLEDGGSGSPATMHVDELGELFDLELDDDDVDTVGGLLAKALGRVPIPGARAVVEGLELTAERPAGRRHRVATVLVRDVRRRAPRRTPSASDPCDTAPDSPAEPPRTGPASPASWAAPTRASPR